MVESTPGTPDSLHRELTRERLKNARRTAAVRFWGVSAFFLLFLILGGLMRLPAWSGNLPLFTVYWVVAVAVFVASRRSQRLALASSLSVPLFDAPLVFFLQWATFPTSNPSGVAGFTVGVYVLLVILAAFALQRWYVLFTAAVVTIYEIVLQHFAGVSVGAMVSSAILLGLAAAACLYAQHRLLRFVQRADRHLRAHRRAAADRRHAGRVAGLAALARDLSATLDPATVAQRTVESIARLLGANTAVLFRVEPASGALVSIATTGVMRESFPDGTRLPSGAGATGLAVLSRKVVTTPDVLGDPRIVMPVHLRDRVLRSDHRAACAVPLIARGMVIGGLGVGDVRGRIFTDDEVHLAQAFADHAAFSLENARLYAELDGHLRQLEQAQHQLVQSEKLAAVGQLATGIAHEVNNPLATIMGQAEMLKRQLTDPALSGRVAKIADSALRAAEIVQGLQTFVRPGLDEMVPLHLPEIVERVLVRREGARALHGVSVATDLPEDLPAVLGNRRRLEQAVLNLVLNAEHAAAGAATTRITVAVRAHDGRVRLSIADSGAGIPASILPRIFEPFFTTKAPNQHAGLGLSIAYSIVQSHGGRLTVESAPGSGATFTLDLPALPDAPPAPPSREPAAGAASS
jgi:signal transduction histidine kinase